MTKQALEFTDLLIPYVVPDFEDGKVGPVLTLFPSMELQAGPDATAGGHSYIYDIEQPAAARAMTLVEHVHPPKVWREIKDLLLSYVLCESPNKPQWTLWHR